MICNRSWDVPDCHCGRSIYLDSFCLFVRFAFTKSLGIYQYYKVSIPVGDKLIQVFAMSPVGDKLILVFAMPQK